MWNARLSRYFWYTKEQEPPRLSSSPECRTTRSKPISIATVCSAGPAHQILSKHSALNAHAQIRLCTFPPCPGGMRPPLPSQLFLFIHPCETCIPLLCSAPPSTSVSMPSRFGSMALGFCPVQLLHASSWLQRKVKVNRKKKASWSHHEAHKSTWVCCPFLLSVCQDDIILFLHNVPEGV